MDYTPYCSPPASHGGRGGAYNYSSPTALQNRANLRSCLRQGNFSSNRSTRSTPSAKSLPTNPQQQYRQQSRDDDEDDRTARSAPTTTGSVISNENIERQFMKLSNTLVTQHKSGNYSSLQGTRQLLHYYIPSARQRHMFFQSLRQNKSFLPMFPEPNEHPSYAITRYVDKVFGPLLENETFDISVDTSTGNPPSPSRITQSSFQMYNTHIHQQQSMHNFSIPITVPPPPPLDYSNHQPLLFPTPIAARDEVQVKIDRIPPPIQTSFPMTSPLHLKQEQHAHVSFPQNYSPAKSISREPQRDHLPRPHHAPTAASVAPDQPPSFTSPSKSRFPTISDELNKHTHLQHYPSMKSKSLLNNASSETSFEGSSAVHHDQEESIDSRSNTSIDVDTTTAASTATNNALMSSKDDRRSKMTTTTLSTGYQKFTNSNMLPPITPRENILYSNLSSSRQMDLSTSCCNKTDPPKAKRKRPIYLQLYVKCERSEPFLQPSKSMDIVTLYRNGNNKVTADRTLVVRGTTSLLDLIGGIIEAFGLFSPHSDACMKASPSSPLLMAYNDICFVSDVKETKNEKDESTILTPLPIPGFFYKYVDREVHGRTETEKESVLSTDPVVLTRTLVAQVLDKPLYQSKLGYGIRSRLALVYCAPKREAYVSSRTQRGVLPETIYHFQILLEGNVNEDDLPSSFQTQTAIRCVRSTGGVAGGSMIDSKEEIQDLNRALWGVRDVVGLVNSTPDPQRNLEQIIDLLGVPLFDDVGNQTLKELPLDRCLYHIYSGNLSICLAKKTQQTVEKMQGTTQWLAKGVEALTKGITSCGGEDDMMFVGGDIESLNSMSRLSLSSSKSRTRRMSNR